MTIYSFTENIEWAPRAEVLSDKLNDMADNERFLKQQLDQLPKGVLAVAKIKKAQSSTATVWDIPGLNCRAEIGTNRIIRATLNWPGLCAPFGATGTWAIQIANITSGDLTICEQRVDINRTNVIMEGGSMWTLGIVTSPLTVRLKARVSLVAGTAGLLWESRSTAPSELVIEDVGSLYNEYGESRYQANV